jgi:plastocyanin
VITTLFAGILIAAAPTGTVRGTLTFTGDAPAPAKIDPQTDREICSVQDLVDESLLVDGKTKGLKNVAVWIEKTKAPKSEPVVENTGCRFEPHVLIVPAKTDVTIKNRDTFLHTAAAKDPKGKDLFNVALPSRDQEAKKKFNAAGPHTLRCDVHPWMKGFVVVTGGELNAVSDALGKFEIKDVPAGKYTVRLWHETLGEKKAEVDVAAGKTANVDLTFSR